MIGGFGRFFRADDTSKNMTDLRAFRCRIAVDSVNDIPHRLSIILGDEVVDILVYLESFERVTEDGEDAPQQAPQPPPPNNPNGERLHLGGRAGGISVVSGIEAGGEGGATAT